MREKIIAKTMDKLEKSIKKNEPDKDKVKEKGQIAYKHINKALDAIETELGDGNPSVYELSYAIAKILKEHYGQHNYSAFKRFLNKNL